MLGISIKCDRGRLFFSYRVSAAAAPPANPDRLKYFGKPDATRSKTAEKRGKDDDSDSESESDAMRSKDRKKRREAAKKKKRGCVIAICWVDL